MTMTFNTCPHPCSFNFYSHFSQFQQDADNMVTFVLRTLGEDVLGVELTKPMIWDNLEQATWKFNGFMVEYQNKSNLASLLGMPTGSTTNTINITDMYVQPNLELLSTLAFPYAGMVGYSQAEQSYMGYITMSSSYQTYDLYDDLIDKSGKTLWSQQPAGTVGGMEVIEVFHSAPVQYVFNSNLASNFVASGLPVESYIPDTRFYVLPLFEDVLRAGMLESAQKVRRSHYSYKISGRKIKIYPCPNSLVPGYNNRIWLRVRFSSSPFPTLASTLVASGSAYSPTGSGVSGSYQEDKIYGANGPFNTPYGALNYNSLNTWCRNWIAQYCLALSTIQLGRIRSKFKSFPVPGADLELNGSDLVTQGREDRDKLIETLKATLDELTYDKISEREATKAENMVKQLSYVPMPPKYCIGIF